jgi:hypothetical protein
MILSHDSTSRCQNTDFVSGRLEEKKGKCEDIGVRGEDARKVKKGRITCQAPLPGSLVPAQTHIVYVLAN